MWLEDMPAGDYVPWVNPPAYRKLTVSTSTPIHTGEQIYLRHNFKELIETQACGWSGLIRPILGALQS